MLAKCDHCEKEFTVEFQTIETVSGVSKTFFVCPHCEKEYLAYFKNEEVKKKQKDIKQLYGKIGNPGLKQKQQNQLIKKIKKEENKVKEMMNELKEKYK